nr:unnamed protein product [Digitaria exilis]
MRHACERLELELDAADRSREVASSASPGLTAREFAAPRAGRSSPCVRVVKGKKRAMRGEREDRRGRLPLAAPPPEQAVAARSPCRAAAGAGHHGRTALYDGEWTARGLQGPTGGSEPSMTQRAGARRSRRWWASANPASLGLLMLADEHLSEQTTVYFYVAKANDFGKVDHSIAESFAQRGRMCITAIYDVARVFLFMRPTLVSPPNHRAPARNWAGDEIAGGSSGDGDETGRRRDREGNGGEGDGDETEVAEPIEERAKLSSS